MSFYRMYKTETSTSNHESDQQDSLDQEINIEISVFFFLKQNYFNN